MAGMSNETTPVAFPVRRVSDTAAVIEMVGDVTAGSEGGLMQAFESASEKTTRVIGLDFGPLEYMNSGGIGLLVTLLVRANRQRQQLVAFGLNEHYRQIFSLTRLDEAITLHDSQDEALTTAKAPR